MKKVLIYIGIPIFLLFAGAFSMYLYIEKHPSIFRESVTKVVKDVTVNENGISDAVSKIYDSVVTVSTYKNSKPYASGTGFVYKKSDDVSYILTNAHVINNSDEVFISLTNGVTEKANVIGKNEMSDIAVLSISSDKVISYASIGSSDKAKLGDTVFAVGAPLDSAYSWSVTRGILSGKNRLVEVTTDSSKSLYNDSYMMNVLQTDAAINSGNSGGPLANSNGEVIGITSLKLVSSGVEGMSFAIPIENAIKYADKIINKEEIVLPYFGAVLLNLSEAYNYREFRSIINDAGLDKGVVVASVVDGSPASEAGLKQGDIITKVNNESAISTAYIRYILYTHEVGDKLSITYVRNNKENSTNIKLGKK